MKIPNRFARVLTAVLMVAGLGVLAGCGSDTDDGSASVNKDAKTVVVATRGTVKPYSYTDDDGKLTGYDVEILKEIEKRDPSLHFTFRPMAVDAAFVAMDSSQVDMIANQMRHSPARDEKYIFPKELNNYTVRKLVVPKDDDATKSLDDLKGKKVAVTTNSEFAELVKKFNETADTPIEIVYTDKGPSETMNLVATGRAQAAGEYEYIVSVAQKDKNLPIKTVGPTLTKVPTYFLLRKDDEMQKVADKIDAALKSMREDGTLKALSEKYLGADYTEAPTE